MNDSELWKKIMDETLLPKWADADEIAELAYFLTLVNKSMTARIFSSATAKTRRRILFGNIRNFLIIHKLDKGAVK